MWLSRTILLSAVVLSSQIFQTSAAIWFYLTPGTSKCFYEDLPKDTLLVGKFRAEEFDQSSQKYSSKNELEVRIIVEELFDNDSVIVNQKGTNSGRFTFTTHNSGEHRLCFSVGNLKSQGTWIGGHHEGAKLYLDLAIGETSDIEGKDKEKINDLVHRVKELTGRLQDIRREQVFQREREAEFRDQSESTNGRVVRWALIQITVLGVTCAWQLSHLRAFFIKQKLT